MKTCIVTPVKDFRDAKQRLAGALSNASREQLARWLCQQTLQFFQHYFPRYPLLVVTASHDVARLAAQQGAAVLMESTAAGVSAAARAAAVWACDQGFDSMLLMPADIARLDPQEIQTLLQHPRTERSVVICPAHDAGTNALLCTPPNVISFHFGERSSEAHQSAAEQAGVRCDLLRLQCLSVDLDTSEDLWALPPSSPVPLRVNYP